MHAQHFCVVEIKCIKEFFDASDDAQQRLDSLRKKKKRNLLKFGKYKIVFAATDYKTQQRHPT